MFDSFLSTNFSYFLVSICFYRRASCVFPQVNYFHATFMARSISFSEGRAFLSIQYSTVKHIIARFCGLFMCPRFDASDSLYLNSNGQRLTLNNSNTLAGKRESRKAGKLRPRHECTQDLGRCWLQKSNTSDGLFFQRANSSKIAQIHLVLTHFKTSQTKVYVTERSVMRSWFTVGGYKANKADAYLNIYFFCH